MSDDFIPLNQSTPVQRRWQGRNQNQRFQTTRYDNGSRRASFNNSFNNRWINNSQRNTSYASESNSSFGNTSQNNIDAYIHPSMLQDPWKHLYKTNS